MHSIIILARAKAALFISAQVLSFISCYSSCYFSTHSNFIYVTWRDFLTYLTLLVKTLAVVRKKEWISRFVMCRFTQYLLNKLLSVSMKAVVKEVFISCVGIQLSADLKYTIFFTCDCVNILCFERWMDVVFLIFIIIIFIVLSL